MNPYFIFYNANPKNNYGNDCTIRAISLLTNKSWYEVYDDICLLGREVCDMPSSNRIWSRYLQLLGYTRYDIDPSARYNVNEFCHYHPINKYLLCLNEHVVAVMGGHFYDTNDIGYEFPLYYWKLERR